MGGNKWESLFLNITALVCVVPTCRFVISEMIAMHGIVKRSCKPIIICQHIKLVLVLCMLYNFTSVFHPYGRAVTWENSVRTCLSRSVESLCQFCGKYYVLLQCTHSLKVEPCTQGFVLFSFTKTCAINYARGAGHLSQQRDATEPNKQLFWNYDA